MRAHWPEYLCEAALLGGFMVSACVFAIVLFHPLSPAARAIESPLLTRALMGVAMGLTAIALIYSPLGSSARRIRAARSGRFCTRAAQSRPRSAGLA